MAIQIHKAVKEDQNALVAEHDLYFDGSKEKVLVVEEGQPVPDDAAFVLAMKGSRVPPQHVELVKRLGEAEKAESPEAEVQPEAQVTSQPESPQPQQVGVIPEVEPAKEKNKK